MKWSLVSKLLLSVSLAGSAALPASAVDLGFDDLDSLSDVAAATLQGVSVSTALVLSEADADALGYPASGTFATSPSQGLLNTLAPTIRFTFEVPVTSFTIDILSLDKDGVTLPVLLEGFDGLDLVNSVSSNTSTIGDSGYHEDTLSIFGLFTSVVLSASDETSTFWLDSASFTPVPEPGTLPLLGAGLTALAGLARGRGRRA